VLCEFIAVIKVLGGSVTPRACLKNDKTPKQRISFHFAALKIFEIHKVSLQMFAPPGEKISRRCAFRHLSNKA
jgi:hypothetical protein